MHKVLNLYKPVGVTPLQLIEKFREQNPVYANTKLGYAGRLDPMAEGILLVLVGDENLKRKSYERLQKTYEFEVLFGISTDSYDVLGLPQMHEINASITEQQLLSTLTKFIGKQIQYYPPYSSPRVQGKPLFYWARNNRLDEITIPAKEIEIYSLGLKMLSSIPSPSLQKRVYDKIDLVSGDFRQEQIKTAWQDIFPKLPHLLKIAEITISCSSGTYVRSCAHALGQKLNTGAISLSIQRTTIGEYNLKNSIKV